MHGISFLEELVLLPFLAVIGFPPLGIICLLLFVVSIGFNIYLWRRK